MKKSAFASLAAPCELLVNGFIFKTAQVDDKSRAQFAAVRRSRFARLSAVVLWGVARDHERGKEEQEPASR